MKKEVFFMKNMHIAFSPRYHGRGNSRGCRYVKKWLDHNRTKDEAFEKKLSEYNGNKQGGLSEFSNSLPGDDTASSGNWTGR